MQLGRLAEQQTVYVAAAAAAFTPLAISLLVFIRELCEPFIDLW